MYVYDPYAEFEKNVLSNGLEVHSAYWDRSWIVVEVVVHSGAREDPVAMPGLAHFVEHLVSENIPDWKFDQAKEFLEACGGTVKFGRTGYLSTEYKFVIPANLDIFREALDIFGSMLLGAQIKNGVERERKAILREFNERYSFPEKLEWEMGVYSSLFKGHRLETYNRPLGRPEGFLSTTEADLQGFYDKHYVPANISLVVVGGLSTGRVVVELQESLFGMQKKGGRNPIPPPFQTSLPVHQSKTVKMSEYTKLKVDQTAYQAKWAFPVDFPKRARVVFSQMLNKILFDEVRNNLSLAYSIGVDSEFFQDVLAYKVSGIVSPQATTYINELVRKCIQMVPLKRDLFDHKLRSLKQKCLMEDLSGSDLARGSARDLVSDHRIILIQEDLNDLQKVTFEQMDEAASLLSSERQFTFITCP